MSSTPRRLQIGAAYYPEHWQEEHWAEDIRLMRAAGLTVVRMGEFAWSSLEPAQDQFQFDWLERAIAQLSEAGIATVLGTPTAAPPAWLTQACPQTLAIDETGRRVQHGRQSLPLLRQLPGLSGCRAADRRRDGGTLRQGSAGDRLADRQ
jgi:beta-galactosidase GanA